MAETTDDAVAKLMAILAKDRPGRTFRIVTGEGLHAYEGETEFVTVNEVKRIVQTIYNDISTILPTIATLTAERALAALGADKARLDWLTQHPNAELTHSGWSDDVDEWQLHTVNGGRNDREWTLRGAGDTPRDAIDTAMRTMAVATQEKLA